MSAKFAYRHILKRAEQQYEYVADALGVKNETRNLSKGFTSDINATATYDFTEKSQIGVSAGVGMLLGGKWRNETTTTLTDNTSGTVQQAHQVFSQKAPSRFPFYVSAFYMLDTDNRGSGLDMSVSYSKRKEETKDTMSVVSDIEREGWLTTPYRQDNLDNSHGVNAEANYKKFFADGSCFKTGVAYDISRIDDNVQFFDLIGNSYVNNDKRSSRFVYDENVAGAYVEYNRSWNKVLSSSVGLRAEYTHTHGNQHVTGETFSHDWMQWFPNVGLNYSASNGKHIVGIDYGTYAWHPRFREVDPFKYWTSSNTYKTGNPDIEPTKSHDISLNYRFLQRYNFSVSYGWRQHVWEAYTVDDGNGVSKTGYGDLGRSRSVSLGLRADHSFFGGMWYFNANVSANYQRYKGKVEAYPLNQHSWNYRAGTSNRVFFTKARDLMLMINYKFVWKSRGAVQTEPARHGLTIVLDKTFDFGGTVEAGFIGSFPWKDKTFYETSSYYYQSRSLTSPAIFIVGYMHRFGKKHVRGANQRGSSKFANR